MLSFLTFFSFHFFSAATLISCALSCCQNKTDTWIFLPCVRRSLTLCQCPGAEHTASTFWCGRCWHSSEYRYPLWLLHCVSLMVVLKMNCMYTVSNVHVTVLIVQFCYQSDVSGLLLVLLYSHHWILRNILKIFRAQRIVTKQIAEDTTLQMGSILTLDGLVEV